MLWNDLDDELKRRESSNLRRVLRGVPDGTLDLASNDYLGLATHPEVTEYASKAALTYGAGARSSRLVSGNYALFEELEFVLAVTKKTESALVFPTGYAANVGLITALCDANTAIFCHKRNHASLIDACRLAEAGGAKLRYYEAESKLVSLLESSAAQRRIIVADGVFSMDGDLLDLPPTLQLAQKYDAYLIVDDAHGTGTLGKYGTGIGEHFDVHDDRIIWVGTLSKALGSQGGFVAGKHVLTDFLVNSARSFIYTTGLNPAAVGAALKSLEIIRLEPQRIAKCRSNARTLAEALNDLGLDARLQPSPILPVIVGQESVALALSAQLEARGFWCPAIRYPTVPRGKSRLRLTISAGWSENDLSAIIAAFRDSITRAS